MKYTKVEEQAYEKLQFNAGIVVKSFEPSNGTATGILGATKGGLSFTAVQEFIDRGANIDNVPNNTKQLKQGKQWNVNLAGTFVTVDPEKVKLLLGAGDVSENKIVPRHDLKDTDFQDIWLVGDYSDKTGETNGGYCAVHLMNTLSTSGLSWKTTDEDNGEFSFNFMAHYDIGNIDKPPFEVYVKAGTPEAA